ncbi:hypothetical protein PsorP6_007573 [Peronosclerospora sorghi]|uniref:Uncharacterized protein n=1 Tax=Peronosclerospora sorghi TaxID=230839 RepID=A0ACC0W844_9STRA|nr:hypothetical protein PsorP6_007573 [Peronosclerospora sorghi]
MKIFGQVQFMLFLQQDVRLFCAVFYGDSNVVVNFLCTLDGKHAKLWGEGRRLKIAAYVTVLIYWVVWRGEWADTLRLLGPVFIDSGGVILGSVTSLELQEVCRRIFKRLFNEIGNGIQTDGDLDVCFFFGKVYQVCNDFTETVTYLICSLFVHYAHVRIKIKSMTLFADIDVATQKIHCICCGATVDAAAVVYLILSKTVQQRYLICCRYRDLFKHILTVCVMNTSEYGVLLQILSSPLEQVDAEMLREATAEVERKRDSTFSVVMVGSNAEFALQMDTYEETYGEDLVQMYWIQLD